ncbi:MAG TPA: hypothetical protein HPP87_07325 [Planctomycetes bacterium]|nr:hypothetical protein [Planctomycetota bacterium]
MKSIIALVVSSIIVSAAAMLLARKGVDERVILAIVVTAAYVPLVIIFRYILRAMSRVEADGNND